MPGASLNGVLKAPLASGFTSGREGGQCINLAAPGADYFHGWLSFRLNSSSVCNFLRLCRI
eukprot:scaffold208031_cov19-Tisochrysis_lutea.AAC.2